MRNELSESMKERLERWRKNISEPKSVPIPKKKSPGNFVPRHKDYGDDLEGFKNKENNG